MLDPLTSKVPFVFRNGHTLLSIKNMNDCNDEIFAIEQKQERTRKRRAKKKKTAKFKKAPQAPRRFKSAYMFFSTDQHKQIRDAMGKEGIAEKVNSHALLTHGCKPAR